MVDALVTPSILKWARERRDLAVTATAGKLNIPPEKLIQWERGDTHPTFRQAKKLAEKLYIPFGYLFLDSPPRDNLPLPDFRTISTNQEIPPSPDFLDVLQDTIRKQEWFHDYQSSLGVSPLEFIGRFTHDENPAVIAEDIRNTIGLDVEMRAEVANWEQFLKELITKTEKIGILVLRNGVVGNNPHRPLNVEEFRGFVISDNVAPVIFINGRDAKTAQIFTLAHELAHLWMGQSGISNPEYIHRLERPQNKDEYMANQVAAETLLPSNELCASWEMSKELEKNIDKIARTYRISRFVVLRRAYDNEKISSREYHEWYKRFFKDTHATTGSSGGDFYKSLVARNSNTLTTTLLLSCAEGKISRKEVASLLNVKVKSIPSIQREILGVR